MNVRPKLTRSVKSQLSWCYYFILHFAISEKMENAESRPSMESPCGDMLKEWKKPLELFQEKDIVRICAPMVRYSKLVLRF